MSDLTNKKILKAINAMLKSKNGLSEYELNFISGLKRYYRQANNFSDKQIEVFNEISNRHASATPE